MDCKRFAAWLKQYDTNCAQFTAQVCVAVCLCIEECLVYEYLSSRYRRLHPWFSGRVLYFMLFRAEADNLEPANTQETSGALGHVL